MEIEYVKEEGRKNTHDSIAKLTYLKTFKICFFLSCFETEMFEF